MLGGGGFPLLLPPDPGGGTSSKIDGSHTGPTLPRYMDKDGNHGELVVLRMEMVSGKPPKNPFLLRTSIEHHIKGEIEGAFPEAKGLTYALKVRNKQQIEKLMGLNELLDGTQVKITKHTGLNSVRCVINCQGVDQMSEQECLQALAKQKVTYLRRITRKVGNKVENTSTIILTIDGTVRPDHIDVGYQRCKTRPYYPSPMLCFNCYRFGHTKARCPESTATCGNCAKQHEIVQGERCPDEPFCPRCKNHEHGPSSRKCPVYATEDAIQHIRVDKGLSYPAARRLFDASTGRGSFANVTVASKDKIIEDLSSKVNMLTAGSEEKDRKIAALEEAIKTGRQPTTQQTVPQDLQSAFDELRREIQNKDQQIAQLLEALRKKDDTAEQIRQLRQELRQKDDRIKALEKGQSKENRLTLTRKHGTIEDLVAKVNELQNTIVGKDKELAAIRNSNGTEPKPQRTRKLPQNIQKMTASQTKPEQPEEALSLAPYTGTRKKSVTNQPSSEIDPKRSKAGSPQRIDISDEEMVNDVSSAASNVSIFSAEEGDDQPDTDMEP